MLNLLEIIDNFVVAGYASVSVEDTHGDKFTPDMIRDSAEKYLEEPIVFYSHKWDQPCGLILREHRVDGKIYKTHVDDVGWYVVSRPSKARPDVQNMIREVLLSGYSIGGRKVLDSHGNLVKIEISDLSYVTKPSNKLAYHQVLESKSIHQRIKEAKTWEEGIRIINEAKKRW